MSAIVKASLPKKHLQFNEGRTAEGKEKRTNLKSKEPHSSLASQTTSRHYKELHAAQRGDINALEWLTETMAEEVERHSIQQGWNIKDRSRQMALIALEPYTSEILLSQQKEAEIFGISKAAYQETWLSRADEFKKTVRKWSNK